MSKRIFSGAQPTGNLHIGNYLGALRNWVALQREYESFFCVVNLHAYTVPQDPRRLAEKTREVARIYLAAGIDPEVSTVFVQSDVPEHAYMRQLQAAVAFDAAARVGSINVPTLVITGDADAIVPHENSVNLAAAIPGARPRTIGITSLPTRPAAARFTQRTYALSNTSTSTSAGLRTRFERNRRASGTVIDEKP